MPNRRAFRPSGPEGLEDRRVLSQAGPKAVLVDLMIARPTSLVYEFRDSGAEARFEKAHPHFQRHHPGVLYMTEAQVEAAHAANPGGVTLPSLHASREAHLAWITTSPRRKA